MALAGWGAASGLILMCITGCRSEGHFFEPSFSPVEGIRGSISFFIDDGAQRARVSYFVDLGKGKVSANRAAQVTTYADGSTLKSQYFVLPLTSWCDTTDPFGKRLEPLRSPDGARAVLCRGGPGSAQLSFEPDVRANVALGSDCPVLKGMYWSPDSSWLVLVCGLRLGYTDPARLAVVDVAHLQLKRWMSLPDRFVAKSMTWSPDSQFVAVLAGTDRTDKTAILSALASHPVSLSDYDLLVYRKEKSTPELAVKLARDVRYGFASLVKWR
jgi:hypothetical protein